MLFWLPPALTDRARVRSGAAWSVPAPESSSPVAPELFAAEQLTTTASPNPAVLAVLCLGAAIFVGALIGWLLRKITAPLPAPTDAEATRNDRSNHLQALSLASQRMILALDHVEMQRIAVEEAVVMADADSGAFVALHGQTVEVSWATHPGAFAVGAVSNSIVTDAITTSRPMTRVAEADDEVVSHPPAAVAAVPVTIASGVAGAILVMRSAEEPFTTAEVDRIALLAPITGAALVTASAQPSDDVVITTARAATFGRRIGDSATEAASATASPREPHATVEESTSS